MAGDWIPVRTDLHEDPAVITIAASIGLDEYEVTGRLLRLWSWANRQLPTGEAPGVTAEWIDRHVAAPGFASAMQKAGWLLIEDGKVVFPNFERWNSQSAKRRIEKTMQKRIERSRQSGDTVAGEKQEIPRTVRAAVLERDGNRCVNCGWSPSDGKRPTGLPAFDVLSIDHMIPECRGGQTVPGNLVTLCMGCNLKKAGRTFDEAGMSPDVSHITGDIAATEQRPEKRREEKKEEEKPPNPLPGGETGTKPTRSRARPNTADPGGDFARFWQEYPRKDAKLNAVRAWQKLDPDTALVETILVAVARQRQSEQWQREGGRFIPMPATWINGRRWDDLPPEVAPSISRRPGFETHDDRVLGLVIDANVRGGQ